MGDRLLHLLFFLSGASGLIYQVVWVREFGNVFARAVADDERSRAIVVSNAYLRTLFAGPAATTR